jgi:hypothetical protein
MVIYILLDVTIGSVPILGTIFDWLFEENVINLKSLLRYRDRSRPPRSVGEVGVAAVVVIAVIVAVALLAFFGLVALIIWIANQR